jgi:hypothetical protein
MRHTSATAIHGFWLILVSYYLELVYSQFFVMLVSADDTYGVSVGDPLVPTSFVKGRFTITGFPWVPRLSDRVQTD